MPARLDGVVEAVRYAPDGKIIMVRAYERRGPTFSDRILIDRASLVERLKKGEKFFAGSRQEFLGSSFETGAKLQLVGDFISTSASATGDLLESVPVF